MSRRVRILIASLLLLAALLVFAWNAAVPRMDPQPLPAGLIDLGTSEGQALLSRAEDAADHAALARHFQPQRLNSYCGVASGVAVLAALGVPVTQAGFFDAGARSVRPRWRVVLAGMALDELGGLLDAHGASVSVRHADAFDAQAFRKVVARNLSRPGDYLIVNYDRQVLGQDGSGHISPLAAYDGRTDMVLVMDTAAYKYPQTWVPLDRLHAAMATRDPASDRMRGYVEVRGLDEGAAASSGGF